MSEMVEGRQSQRTVPAPSAPRRVGVGISVPPPVPTLGNDFLSTLHYRNGSPLKQTGSQEEL